jgi:hypothetical protein
VPDGTSRFQAGISILDPRIARNMNCWYVWKEANQLAWCSVSSEIHWPVLGPVVTSGLESRSSRVYEPRAR